jgi:hypothetical protein
MALDTQVPKVTHHVSLPHTVIVRAPGLLPMLYRPAELADDLEIPESTLRDWLVYERVEIYCLKKGKGEIVREYSWIQNGEEIRIGRIVENCPDSKVFPNGK